MEKEKVNKESRLIKPAKSPTLETSNQPAEGSNNLTALQKQVGNRAVQRLVAQRSGEGPSELDDDTAARINSLRGSGQSLENDTQERMGQATGYDFGDVRVHTSSEADQLNQELGAKAFTTGSDVFFREGAYDPGSSSGQELLAHELTHVVQQGSGLVGHGGKMTVNAPGDAYEQEADTVAKTVASPGAASEVQRQEEEEIQMQAVEEEEVQMQAVEEEEEIQMQEEEEEIQMMEAEEEEIQMKEEAEGIRADNR